jgi:hypothetical protein
MGLDNIPVQYACIKLGTAIKDEYDRIDCKKTQEVGCCPWKNQLESSGIQQKVVLGMFGTDCWYRGKYAQTLIDSYETAPYSFYGENTIDDNGEENYGLTAEQCMELSIFMQEEIDDAEDNGERLENHEDWVYIAWWLKFCSENTSGIISWF